MTADWESALARARAHAPFLARALGRQPALAELLVEGRGEDALAAARLAGQGADAVDDALRRERLALATVLAIGDLAGAFSLTQVMEELSALADRALDAALVEAMRRRVPDAEPTGMTALALGKHGARELNYSSDIDPILLYDPARLPRRARDEPGDAAQNYARILVELLTQQTGEGYVFRVDLRLRPASEVSPLAISFDAALSHYESSALAWERAAFIRARAVAGDVAAGEAFLTAIRPFVWRKSLDFTAIEEIRRLTVRIRETYGAVRDPGPGFDVKRGRGGIRECEFFSQTHQLIYGRAPACAARARHRAALDALAEDGVIPAEDAQLLGEAYDRLRRIEHRLQMVDDRQTHTLPVGPALDNVAQLDGYASGEALLADLRETCAAVAARYDRLLADNGRSLSAVVPVRVADDPLAERVAIWKETLRPLRGAEARAALDAIVPDLHSALSAAPDPEHALVRWETLLAGLPSAVNLFRLFEQRPGLLEQVLRVLTLTRPLAEELARRPALLDALIDTTALDLPGSIADLAARMTRGEAGDGYERRLDRIRQIVGEERFALGVQLIEARHDPLDISAALARLAEAALTTAADAACDEFAAVHGRIEESELMILGLGRLGGGALTHVSDLDLIYLFTGAIGRESDGRRPLTASLYFNRLAQRVTAALSVPTAEGALYAVDTRLRPQGNQGPLAVSLDSFARYQRENAWTWEHMALTRARPVFGTPDARERLAALIGEVLAMPRDLSTLAADVLAMRGEMALHKPPSGPLDIKLLRGGLVDVEFAVHFLQLRDQAAFDPDVGTAIATLAVAGQVPARLAGDHALLARLLVAARLLAPDGTEPHGGACEALAQACELASYPALLQALAEARHGVASLWADLFGERLEIE